MMAFKKAVIFIAAFLLCSEKGYTEEEKEWSASMFDKCLRKKWDVLMTKCSFLTPQLKNGFKSCLSDLNVTSTCTFDRTVNEKAFDDCPDNEDKTEAGRKFKNSCWQLCLGRKLSMVTERKLMNSTAAAMFLKTMKIMSSEQQDSLQKEIDQCLLYVDNKIPNDGSPRNSTVDCLYGELSFGCLYNIVAKRMEPCIITECKNMKNELKK